MTSNPDLPILDEIGQRIGAAARREITPTSIRRRWTRTLLGGALTAAAAAVVLAVLAGSGGPSVVDRAYAAVALDGGIRHVISSMSYVDGTGVVRERTEVWLSADGCRGRMRIERPPGTLVTERVEDRYRARSYIPAEHREYVSDRRRGDLWQVSDPVARFRALYQRGRVHDAGRADFRGRPVARLVMTDGDATITYLADADTFLPVEITQTLAHRPGATRTRIVRYERLAAGATRSLAMTPRTGVKVRRRDGTQTAAGRVARGLQRLHCYS